MMFSIIADSRTSPKLRKDMHMPWYGSFKDSNNGETSIGTKPKSKKTTRRQREKERISNISVGVAYDLNNQPVSANTFGSVMADVTSEVDLNTTSETDVESRKHYEPNILEKSLERTICYHLRRRKKTSCLVVSLLCVLTVISNAFILLLGPIYTSSMKRAGGDEIVVLLSLAAVLPGPMTLLSLVLKHTFDKTITLRPAASWTLYAVLGVCQTLRLNMGLFASHPHKTPHTLQPGLSGIVLIFSIIVTLIVFRKGISKRRLACCIVALVGVFLSVEPLIWSVEGSNHGDIFYSHDLVTQIVWPAIFFMSYLPLTVYNVLAERELKKRVIHAFSLATSGMLSACVLTVITFAVDFVPWYGNVSNFPEFWDNFKTGFKCNFSFAPECQNCPIKLIILGASVALFNIFSVLLVSVTEGSVFASLTMCLSIPLASGIWTIFDYNYETDAIAWRPIWTHATIFLLVSIVILVPALVVYNYFSVKDIKDVKREKNGYSDVSSSEYEWE